MLKKIPSDQLRVGMFLHELCGSWMDHPFWKARFLMKDAGDVARVIQCGIGEVWIDTAKGLDVDGGRSSDEVAAEVEAELEAAVLTDLAPVVHAPKVKPAGQLAEQARMKVKSLFDEVRMGQAIHADGCVEVVEDIIGSVDRNPGALVSLVRLKTADEYTYLHSVAVCALMVSLARTLGLSPQETREAGLSGLLHDMGKAKIPLEVLNKPGRLTDDEFNLIKKHPEWGHALLIDGGGAPDMALDVCLHHHEKYDGSGYPSGLKGPDISLYARMGSVCDVYDAITSARPYKSAWDPGEAVRQMAQWKGHFDPQIFQAFVKTVGIYPIGTLVRLKSARLGVVLDQNSASLLTPRVKVFFSLRSNLHITPEIVDLSAVTSRDRILGVESPETWKFQNLEALWLDEVSQSR